MVPEEISGRVHVANLTKHGHATGGHMPTNISTIEDVRAERVALMDAIIGDKVNPEQAEVIRKILQDAEVSLFTVSSIDGLSKAVGGHASIPKPI